MLRLDLDGAVVFGRTPPRAVRTAREHARLMAETFPELPEAAAVEMGAEALPLSLSQYERAYEAPDRQYESDKRWANKTRRW